MKTNCLTVKDTFWHFLKMLFTMWLLCSIIDDIRGLARVGGMTHNYSPLVCGLIGSVVLVYWTFEVVWIPIDPPTAPSVSTGKTGTVKAVILQVVNIAIFIAFFFYVSLSLFSYELELPVVLSSFLALFLLVGVIVQVQEGRL